ncbi:MAG: hypothetical protein MZV65_38150 [Chromatiales bacterium]|nr:hypothetical protein [Chromatiales bacterium]
MPCGGWTPAATAPTARADGAPASPAGATGLDPGPPPGERVRFDLALSTGVARTLRRPGRAGRARRRRAPAGRPLPATDPVPGLPEKPDRRAVRPLATAPRSVARRLVVVEAAREAPVGIPRLRARGGDRRPGCVLAPLRDASSGSPGRAARPPAAGGGGRGDRERGAPPPAARAGARRRTDATGLLDAGAKRVDSQAPLGQANLATPPMDTPVDQDRRAAWRTSGRRRERPRHRRAGAALALARVWPNRTPSRALGAGARAI